MGKANRRVFKLSFVDGEYLSHILHKNIVTTRIIENALDITDYPTDYLEFLYSHILQAGFPEVHMVAWGVDEVNEYGVETYYERMFQRSDLTSMMKFTIQDVEEKDGIDEN